MDARALDAVEEELIAIFADLSVALGLPRSLGQIYGLAFASPQPICFDDVVSRLGLSKGSASQGIRVLRALGALRAAPSAGSAPSDRQTVEPSDGDSDASLEDATARRSDSPTVRQYLLPETSVRALLGAIVRQRVQPPLASGAERLDKLRASLPSGRKTVRRSDRSTVRPPARVAHLQARIHSLETWHQKARRFLPIFLKLAG